MGTTESIGGAVVPIPRVRAPLAARSHKRERATSSGTIFAAALERPAVCYCIMKGKERLTLAGHNYDGGVEQQSGLVDGFERIVLLGLMA